MDESTATAAEAAPEPATETAPAEAAPETKPWEGKTIEEVWAKNEELIGENKRYRERFAPIEQTFGRLHPEDAQFFQGFLGAVASGDTAAIGEYGKALRAALDQMSPAEQAAAVDALEDAAEEADPWDDQRIQGLVHDSVQKALGQFAANAQREQTIQQTQTELQEHASKLAKSTGIPQLADPKTAMGRLLWISAYNDFRDEPDPRVRLDKAAAAIKASLDESGQALLRAKAAGGGPSPAPAEAAGPSGARKPEGLKGARASALERVEKAMRGEVGT